MTQEEERLRDCLSRIPASDLFARMLLTGKLKAILRNKPEQSA
jgi:hypothetical protein